MKYCSKCGKEISEADEFCPNCGGMANKPESTPVSGVVLNKTNIISIVCFVMAGLILIISLIACIKISGGAHELSVMRSVAGDTIAEAYYNECGAVYGGLAMFVMAFGLFASSIISYLGYKTLKK